MEQALRGEGTAARTIQEFATHGTRPGGGGIAVFATGILNNHSPIGVDIGRHSVKLVQLDRPGPAGKVVAAASAALPAGLSLKDENYSQWVTAALKQALGQANFIGKRCVSCPPASAMHIKSIRLPKMPMSELRDAVEFEAKDRLPTRDPLTVQFLQAGEVRQGDDLREEIILLAISTPTVEQHVKCLMDAGLRPVAVDATPCALARLLPVTTPVVEQAQDASQEAKAETPATPTAAQSRVLVDIGFDASKVLILRDGQVVFFKLVQVGGQSFDQEISQHLGIERVEANDLRQHLEERNATPTGTNVQRAVHDALRTPIHELAREIELCLRYFGVTFRGTRPGMIEVTGGESASPLLLKLLSEHLAMPVTACNFNDDTGGDKAIFPDHAGRFALATGLARRAEVHWADRRKSTRRAAA